MTHLKAKYKEILTDNNFDIPEHYKADVDVIEFCEQHFNDEEIKGFYKFNVIKYATRLGRKDDELKEFKKIREYANRAIRYLEEREREAIE